ncbi:hypothetical protein GGH94_004230 [Coemansia aciculifera]|uniref:Uncharacterized protein n=1 Tax=Coemansia aciculifera TaxID=417176 RepID=A0A9W8IFN7_9FUNG|nr:hypothetical protein GGH94_004230 [Coemansia aciculifera]
MTTDTGNHQTGFWPRLFRPANPDVRPTKLRRRPREQPPATRQISWGRRSYAHSAASAVTAVAAEQLAPVVPPKDYVVDTAPRQQSGDAANDGTLRSTRHKTVADARVAGVIEQFPEPLQSSEDLQEFCITPSSAFLKCSSYSMASSFWRDYDRRISMGGAGAAASRVIVDAMVDDITTSSVADGWRVDEGRGTFNDVLSNTNSLHPIVMAFVRAHVEGAHVILGPEHVWLAVLQGVSAMLRHSADSAALAAVQLPAMQRSVAGGASSVGLFHQVVGANSAQYTGGAGGVPDLGELWRVLRTSSDIPMACTASTGHEVRVFGTDMYDRHELYAGRGAAPLAMAAAAAGHSRGSTRSAGRVEYGRIGSGSRSVTWQPQQRRTNPAWASAVAAGAGVSGLKLAGSLQAWAALCVLTRQLKALHAGRSRAFDWWLHRVHLLSRDLADYFAAQDEFAPNAPLPKARRRWLDSALFDGHSGAPRGARLDGWLAALFPLDANAEPIHEQDRWWVDWEAVPSGIDLLRASVGGSAHTPPPPDSWLNLYSGFVGVQQLSRDTYSRSRGHTRTLQGDDLDAALGITRDHATTLVDDQEPVKATTLTHDARAIAPLIGWAMDH